MASEDFFQAWDDLNVAQTLKRIAKCICELQSKRNEVATLKSDLSETTRQRMTLERDAKAVQGIVVDLRQQLEVSAAAINRKEALKAAIMESSARQAVHLEALTNEKERLTVKLDATQTRIMELTRENNSLKEQLKIVQANNGQSPGDSVRDRVWQAMNSLNSHLQALELEQGKLRSATEYSNNLTVEADKALGLLRDELIASQKQCAQLNEQLAAKDAVLLTFESNRKIATDEGRVELVRVQQQLKQFTVELENERKTNVQLQSDISALALLQHKITTRLGEVTASDDGFGGSSDNDYVPFSHLEEL